MLQLEHDKFYVGYSVCIRKMINSHFSACGCPWTTLHKPLAILEVNGPVTKKEEKTKTLEFMRLYGWENVRGYAWSRVIMDNSPKEL